MTVDLAKKTRLLVTTTKEIYVDVSPETAERLTNPSDYSCVYDFATRAGRIAHNDIGHVYRDAFVKPAPDYEPGYDGIEPVDEDQPEQYLWCARDYASDARTELKHARHRQGDVKEIDDVIAELARVEERIRQMAWTAKYGSEP